MILKRLTADPADILQFYDRLQEVAAVKDGVCSPTILTELIRNHQYYWRTDDYGFISFYPMEGRHAHIHLMFWDRKLRGREQATRNAIISLMISHGIQHVWTSIPADNRVTIAFAKRAGMREVRREGGLVTLYDALTQPTGANYG